MGDFRLLITTTSTLTRFEKGVGRFEFKSTVEAVPADPRNILHPQPGDQFKASGNRSGWLEVTTGGWTVRGQRRDEFTMEFIPANPNRPPLKTVYVDTSEGSAKRLAEKR